jgi:hypothetical protein
MWLAVTLYYHRFQGHCAAGDQFNYGWFANSIRTLTAAQAAAVAWNATLWNGVSAGNGLKDHVNSSVAMENVTTVTVDPLTGKQLARTDTAQAIVGTAAFTAMPADVALCVSLRTDLPQRAGRGRFYLPQPSTAESTTVGRVQSDFVLDLMAALTLAWTNYNTASDRPVIFHRKLHTTTNLTSFNIGDLFDTQRRRENKVTESRTTASMP